LFVRFRGQHKSGSLGREGWVSWTNEKNKESGTMMREAWKENDG